MRLEFLQSHAWQVSLGRFVVLLATAFIVGLLLNEPLYAVLAASLGYSIWSLVSLYQIQTWLSSRRRRPPPEDRGVWSDISAHMYKKLHTERSRKRRLVSLLRAFREGAAALPDGVVADQRPFGRMVQRGRRAFLGSWRHATASIDTFLPARRATGLHTGAEPLREVPSERDEPAPVVPADSVFVEHMLVVRDVTPLARLGRCGAISSPTVASCARPDRVARLPGNTRTGSHAGAGASARRPAYTVAP